MVQVSSPYQPRPSRRRTGRQIFGTGLNDDLKLLAERAKRAQEERQGIQTRQDVIANSDDRRNDDLIQRDSGSDIQAEGITTKTATENWLTKARAASRIPYVSATTEDGTSGFKGGLPNFSDVLLSMLGRDAPDPSTITRKPQASFGGSIKTDLLAAIPQTFNAIKGVVSSAYKIPESKLLVEELDKKQQRQRQIEESFGKREIEPRFRDNTPEQQEYMEKMAAWRERFRESASGAEPTAPVREGFRLNPEDEPKQPGVWAPLSAAFKVAHEGAELAVANALTGVPQIIEEYQDLTLDVAPLGTEAGGLPSFPIELDEDEQIQSETPRDLALMQDSFQRLKDAGVPDQEARLLAYRSTDLPQLVKGSLELGLDPLNLLPIVGWGGDIARGFKAAFALRNVDNALRSAANTSPEVAARLAESGETTLEQAAKVITGQPVDEVAATRLGATPEQLRKMTDEEQAQWNIYADIVETKIASKVNEADHEAVRQAVAELAVSKEGTLGRLVENIPGLNKVRDLERALASPEGRQIAIAQSAADKVHHTMSGEAANLANTLLPRLDEAFETLTPGARPTSGAKLNIQRLTQAQDSTLAEPVLDTLVDVMERPGAYNLSKKQREAIDSVIAWQNTMLDRINPHLSTPIRKYQSPEGDILLHNQAFIPHVERLIKAGDETEASLRELVQQQRKQTGNPRKHGSIYDRMVSDPVVPKGMTEPEKFFDPSLDVGELLQSHVAAQLDNMRTDIFRRLSGAKSKAEVLDIIRPGILTQVKTVKARLRTIRKGLRDLPTDIPTFTRAQLRLAQEKFPEAIGQGMTSRESLQAVEAALVTSRSNPRIAAFLDDTLTERSLIEKIDTFLDDDSIGSMMDIDDLVIDTLADALGDLSTKQARLRKRLSDSSIKLKQLGKDWRIASASIRKYPYTRITKGGINAFYDDAQVKMVDDLLTEEGGAVRFLRNVKETRFGGDLSPMFINASAGFFFHPALIAKQVARHFTVALKDMWKQDQVIGIPEAFKRAFSRKSLLEQIDAEPELWREYFMDTGRGLRTPDEYSGGLLRKIPLRTFMLGGKQREVNLGKKFAEINENVFGMVERGAFNVYKDTRTSYINQGYPEAIARVLAAQESSAVFLLPQGGKLGQSAFTRRLGAASISSVSFLRKSQELVDLSVRFAAKKFVGKQTSAQEAMAFRRLITFYANVQALTATSAAMNAWVQGRDVEQAVRDSLKPGHSSYMSLHVPPMGKFDGVRIPLGGPFRAAFKVISPESPREGMPPMPFGSIIKYSRNRIHPGLRTFRELFHQIGGEGRESFTGELIASPDDPAWKQWGSRLLWGTEQVLPIGVGEVPRGIRRKVGGGETAQNAVYQFMGVNAYSESPYRQRNELAKQWAKDNLDPETADSVTNFYDLAPWMRQELQNQNPEVEEDIRDEQERLALFGDERALKTLQNEQLKQDRLDVQSRWDDQLKNDSITGRQWKELRRQKRAEIFGKKDQLYSDVDDRDPKTALDRYYAKKNELQDKYGIMTPEAWDDLDAWQIGLPIKDQRYIQENTGLGDNTDTEQAYNTAIRHLRTSGWFTIEESIINEDPYIQAIYQEWKTKPTVSDQADFLREHPELNEKLQRVQRAKELMRREDRVLDAIIGYWFSSGGFRDASNMNLTGYQVKQYLNKKGYGPGNP